jgi:hypothetical protein
MSILYSSSAISIIIKNDCLSATKACRSKMTSVSEVLLWPQAPIFCSGDWHTKWCFIFPIKVTKFS